MNSDIKETARRCQLCQRHKPRNARLPLHSHETPSLPWEVIGADLCYHNGNEYLIVVDSYSFFFEIRAVQSSSASKVISAFTDVFATHGFPSRLITDNGPPFSSQQFQDFISKTGINHVRSSPYHPRSNGMAERAVQEAKKLLQKCQFGSVDFCAALLEWRNTPRDNCLVSFAAAHGTADQDPSTGSGYSPSAQDGETEGRPAATARHPSQATYLLQQAFQTCT